MRPSLRVLVVEDSPTQAAHIRAVLESEHDIRVAAVAATVDEAVAAVLRVRPDAVTMDLDIPGGGGQRAIERIMREYPTPIVVLSLMVDSGGAPAAIEALAAGAVDVLPKPGRWSDGDAAALRHKVRLASGVAVVRRRGLRGLPETPTARRGFPARAVVALGASTGGPAALAAVLRDMGAIDAPVLIVQHIDPRFVSSLATWLARESPMAVSIARAGEHAEAGRIYVAPGSTHLHLAADWRLELVADAAALHCPSADELFVSVARSAGPQAAAGLLTGMGKDGAAGLLRVRQEGGTTVGQDEESSVVFGMSREAHRNGGAECLLPLDAIGPALRQAVERRLA